ncbi:hypothetical protein F5Y08DRAFT_319645 [Xylaria arbuscula]|nr:hypothetical protein F5Y08DRAFT_319645 [Xylaria arbuscula]
MHRRRVCICSWSLCYTLCLLTSVCITWNASKEKERNLGEEKVTLSGCTDDRKVAKSRYGKRGTCKYLLISLTDLHVPRMQMEASYCVY